MNLEDLFEEKGSKAEAGYQPNPNAGQKCINCTMWRDPNKCSAVAGNINPNGWCKWYAGGAYGKRGKKVDEISVSGSVSPKDVNFDSDSKDSNYIKSLNKTPYTVGGFPVYYKNHNGEHTFNIIDDSAEHKILGDMTLSPYANGYYESSVRFANALRGKGLAAELYVLAITKYKIKIISDSQQTPGSKNLWYQLVTKYPSIFTYIVDEYEETIRPVTGDNFQEAYMGDDPDLRLLASPVKIRTRMSEDGRIVRGVNTTVDVGPNEIKIQSAKFANKVDKDGFPPFLKSNGKTEEPKYTLREWAAIQGGHTLEEEKPKLFSWFLNDDGDKL